MASVNNDRRPQAQMPIPPLVAQGASLIEHLPVGEFVPIEGASLHPNATFIERQKKELFQRLTLVLTAQMLPPLVKLISEYAVSALTLSPTCHTLYPPTGLLFAGFNGGNVGANRENALFFTTTSDSESLDFQPSTAHSQLVRIKEEGEAFVSHAWRRPHNRSWARRSLETVHTVQTGEKSFYFETLSAAEGARASDDNLSLVPSPWDKNGWGEGAAFYDPWGARIWSTRSSELVGISTGFFEEIRCVPSNPHGLAFQRLFFGDILSPSRIVTVHNEGLRLFSLPAERNTRRCTEVCRYEHQPLVPFVTATSIPRSTRFIAALKNNEIIYVNPDLVDDRFVVQHDFVIEDKELAENWPRSEVLSMASNSTAVATIQAVTRPDYMYGWECGISLWDHESAQRISYLVLPQPTLVKTKKSWFSDNHVLILSPESHNEGIADLSLIDFRVNGGKG